MASTRLNNTTKEEKTSLVQIRFFAMQKNQSTRIQAQNPPPIKELL